jgi:hypothetical protein
MGLRLNARRFAGLLVLLKWPTRVLEALQRVVGPALQDSALTSATTTLGSSFSGVGTVGHDCANSRMEATSHDAFGRGDAGQGRSGVNQFAGASTTQVEQAARYLRDAALAAGLSVKLAPVGTCERDRHCIEAELGTLSHARALVFITGCPKRGGRGGGPRFRLVLFRPRVSDAHVSPPTGALQRRVVLGEGGGPREQGGGRGKGMGEGIEGGGARGEGSGGEGPIDREKGKGTSGRGVVNLRVYKHRWRLKYDQTCTSRQGIAPRNHERDANGPPVRVQCSRC